MPADRMVSWGQEFAQNFRFGRQTQFECHPEPLPEPAFSCDAVEENFIDRLGLSCMALRTGGANGCIDFVDPDNLGLKGCMLQSIAERDSVNISLGLRGRISALRFSCGFLRHRCRSVDRSLGARGPKGIVGPAVAQNSRVSR